ncbi:hypothetical protein NM208_g8913 [Fusarium decemcellulare]|uniref:Uncharacterized protein n=1 Tax=Fusarium decemcellulare TaxID=57161 RepID=A0ACC1S3I9_9HYPO|nr:hypothetical protein NM208_g8913 [Fusarium decemcellulare]
MCNASTLNDQLYADAQAYLLTFGSPFMPDIVTKTQGVYFWTASGKKVMDWTSGQMSCLIGHGHPEIVQTLKHHAESLDHLYSGMVSPPVIELGKRLTAALPDGLDKAIFLSTGSESNECAIKLAKTVTGKFEIVGLGASWHGMTSGANGAQYHTGRKGYGPLMPGMHMLPSPDAYRSIFRHPDGSYDWETELNYGWSLVEKASCGSLAAVIMEPILSSGGIIAVPDGYMSAMKKHCEKRGMLLIVDEAQTAMGRSGHLFAIEHEGVVPDILTLSKTLGNGLPLSAVVTSNLIAKQAEEQNFLFYTTHANDPLPASVGLKVLEIVQRDDLVEEARKKGDRLHAALWKLYHKYACIGDIRGRGLMAGVEIVSDREAKAADIDLGRRLSSRMMELGLSATISARTTFSGCIRIAPPVTILEEELEEGLRIFEEALRTTEGSQPCDEAVNGCGQCSTYGVSCPGYRQQLVWVSLEGGKLAYVPNRRRVLNFDSTWNMEEPVYTSAQLDTMLSSLNLDLDHGGAEVIDELETMVGPYTVFRHFKPRRAGIIAALSATPDWDARQRSLFHHYVIAVAPLMMPFEESRNPWNSTYPRLAQSQYDFCHDCLLYGIWSQAAANLAHLNCRPKEMLQYAHIYRNQAITLLRQSLDAGQTKFVIFLAATLTLIMAESYLGMNQTWRVHLEAAWSYLASDWHMAEQPWLLSESAWETAQSLCLLKIRTACLTQPAFGYLNDPEAPQDESNMMTYLTRQNIVRSVMERPEFGFTAGFDRRTINCLLQADTYIQSFPTANFGHPNEDLVMEFIQKTLMDSKLEDSRNETPQTGATRPQLAASHHSRVVRNGMLIYLYRTLGNYSPSEVAWHVSAVFEGVEHYRQAGGRNLTVWPVFQAAVEACTEADQAKARAWLADSLRLGIGNRYHIKKIVEQTWARRRLVADTLGLDMGDVVLDWREIRREANLDVLLV